MPVAIDPSITTESFHSILYKNVADLASHEKSPVTPPMYFIDLNLDQVVQDLIAGLEQYDLAAFFYTPLHDRDAIVYRQEIMKDVEQPSIFSHITLFCEQMQHMREALSNVSKSRYKYQKERLFLDAIQCYLDAVRSLESQLLKDDIQSRGLSAFKRYLTAYIQSADFITLYQEANALIDKLSLVKYGIQIKELLVRVLPYQEEADYSQEIERLFEKFKQQAVKDYRMAFLASAEMNHVEAAILEGVVQLYPDLFQQLDVFCKKNTNFRDKAVSNFDREVQFYLAYLKYISPMKEAGLSFCYPDVSSASKAVYNQEGFDIALAHKLVNKQAPVITNNFYLQGRERIIIVSGPNQGGKTTFARTFGQLHHLACLGCAVPGKESALFLFDRLLTHFEKEEDLSTHRSKFEDDLFRIHEMMKNATPDSIVIMNEILSSTALEDAVFLSKKIMQKISALDALCVWVTFIDELIATSDKTVSMTSMVKEDDNAVRTFKVVRRPADGLAYALSIAEKYKVTYADLKKRLKP